MGKLDSGCRKQDYIPQLDDEQTADSVHQLLHKSRNVRFLEQGGQNQVREYCIRCGHARFMEAQADHTFQEIQEESKKALLKLVCRDQAIIDRLWLEQGTRSFIEFLSEVEDQEHLSRTEEMNLTSMDMQRMILIHINMEMEDAQQMGGNVMSVGLMAPLKDFHFVLGTTAPATSIGQPPGGLRTRTGTTRTTQVTVRSE